MPDDAPERHPRTVSVDPPVYLETFATHLTATWKAGGPAEFVDAVRALETVPRSATTVVDDATTAGRRRVPLSEVVPDGDATTYLRVEPDAPWTLSWEARTRPVVSTSGAPPPGLCRRLHLATTECVAWDDEAVATLRRATSEANG
ncbi:hypothetical protein ABNG03_08180 [Halorubrum sp. RMP-47]|uniref:SRPBCC family protein n=1 Tax=Halorubrum miltondacostae TaxID=3076378 RepID=A0ABD5M3I9_9EURY